MSSRGQDCWLHRVNMIKNIVNLPSRSSGNGYKSLVKENFKCKFDKLWLEKINLQKIGSDNLDHNKLRTYKTFKSSFTPEPYIDLVQNRNQRKFLTRFRSSAHNLDIERLRYQNIPVGDRICKYCKHLHNYDKNIDDEFHFFNCDMFINKIYCLKMKMEQIKPGFLQLSNENQFLTLMCPTTAQQAKLVNKFIKILFDCREKIDSGKQPNDIFLNI